MKIFLNFYFYKIFFSIHILGQVTLQWKDKNGKEGSVTSGERISEGMTVWTDFSYTLTYFPEILQNSILFKSPLVSTTLNKINILVAISLKDILFFNFSLNFYIYLILQSSSGYQSITLHTKIDIEIFVCSARDDAFFTPLTNLGYEKINGKFSTSLISDWKSIHHKIVKENEVETLPSSKDWSICIFIK